MEWIDAIHSVTVDGSVKLIWTFVQEFVNEPKHGPKQGPKQHCPYFHSNVKRGYICIHKKFISRKPIVIHFYRRGQNGVKDTRFYDVNEKRQNQRTLILPMLVRVKGLEPLRRKTPDPKSGASAVPPHSHDK